MNILRWFQEVLIVFQKVFLQSLHRCRFLDFPLISKNLLWLFVNFRNWPELLQFSFYLLPLDGQHLLWYLFVVATQSWLQMRRFGSGQSPLFNYARVLCILADFIWWLYRHPLVLIFLWVNCLQISVCFTNRCYISLFGKWYIYSIMPRSFIFGSIKWIWANAWIFLIGRLYRVYHIHVWTILMIFMEAIELCLRMVSFIFGSWGIGSDSAHFRFKVGYHFDLILILLSPLTALVNSILAARFVFFSYLGIFLAIRLRHQQVSILVLWFCQLVNLIWI